MVFPQSVEELFDTISTPKLSISVKVKYIQAHVYLYIVRKEENMKSFCHLYIQVYQKYITMNVYLLQLESF